MSEENIRKELGDFNSIVCFKSVVVGLEDIMGEKGARANLILAGRIRGRALAKELGLCSSDIPMSEWSAMIRKAIGKSGTRLCDVAKVEQDGDIIRVFLSETVCSAGEEPGSPRRLTFTLGAIQGAIEEIMDKKLMGTQTGSVLRGQDYDIIEFKAR